MRKTAFIILLLAMAKLLTAQSSLQTIVPTTPVVAGESFRVQYVLTGGNNQENFPTPDFRPFRLVAGPDVYISETADHTKNYVFTLVMPKPGYYKMPGAVVKFDGRIVKSNEMLLEVISKEMAARMFGQDVVSDYFLRPGENVQQKIKENLFVKVSVNKKTCYVGEPVMATFKLYSRLESRSDIIKNPGFYGFTVYDMVNLQDNMVTTENINGRLFDVHTIRKVQLYPLQAGIFSIDAMLVRNKVEFSKSAVNKKTEQEISEGLPGIDNDDEKPKEGTEVFETDISTEAISITVKAVPEKNKPAGFSGAAGRFSISATLVKNELAKNEEGILEITIAGKGNFVQLNAPAIQWPAGAEGFEPVIKDALDKTSLPLSGSRTFRYPFVCAAPGKYSLPAVQFSFFDTDSNTFKTVSAGVVQVAVSNAEKKMVISAEKKTSIAEQSEKAARKAVIVVVALVLLIVLYWGLKKKEKPPVKTEVEKPALPSVELLLEPAYAASTGGSAAFFKEVHTAIWNFMQQRFEISGSEMNKQLVTEKLNAAGISGTTIQQLLSVLTECEAGIFTNASLEEDKEALLQTTKEILEEIETSLR